MDLLQWQKIQDTVINILAEFGVKIIAAIAFWVIGRWLISKVVAAVQLLREKLQTIPNVVAQPAVEVEILEFNLVGPVLAVRPFCHTNHYWQVYFDSNKLMAKALTEAGFPAPMPAQQVLLQQVV